MIPVSDALFPARQSAYSLADEVDERVSADVPLATDLDETLVKTDLMVEAFIGLFKQSPLYIFVVPFWLFKGIAYLKQQVCKRVSLNITTLPFHQDFLDYLKDQNSRGRKIVLATASDEQAARRVAQQVGIFDQVFASNGSINLSGRRKRDRLVAEFGEKGFDYAGDNVHDLAVWSSARKAIIVNSTERIARRASRVTDVDKIFDGRRNQVKACVKALRLHQWLKNLLVFIPLIMLHKLASPYLFVETAVAFIAFGLCASGAYVMNDLVDISADRLHPLKRERPFASGALSPAWGIMITPLLPLAGLALALLLPVPFFIMLIIYYLLNIAYSLYIKKAVLLDVIFLAGLYTMRIMAGSTAIGIWPSSWLLAFSTFLFLSLALVKRYAELVIMSAVNGNRTQVRGYRVVDKELLATFGAASGYVAVLVLAIYISSGQAEIHYLRHQLIWFQCPLLLYWISYIWLTAHRGRMHDDPLVFTMKDHVSRIVIAVAVALLMLAV